MSVHQTKQGTVHAARAALAGWTLDALDPKARDWLHRAIERTDDRRATELSFGLAPRKLGRQPLSLDAAQLATAESLIAGWRPDLWRIDEAARVLLAAERADMDPATLDRLARHADVAEQSALYRGLALYPSTLDIDALVGAGLRTHVTPVFESIAHCNPWPAARFDEHRWNHLVLKALFMEVPLGPIHGFEQRLNPTLARMVLDFAAERHAAGRSIPEDLWRCVSDEDAAEFHRSRAA